MSSWIQRVSALFGGHEVAAAVAMPPPRRRLGAAGDRPRAHPTVEALPPAIAEPPPLAEQAPIDPQLPIFEWLLGTGASLDTPLLATERRLLGRLDADAARAETLPRAPSLIPQLMNSLRDERQSAHALAERVARDPNLVAEVIRLANGATTRADEPVSDLPQAVLRLGTQGLRRAIARVVLKPIFDAPADSLSGRTAPLLWLHSEAKAAACMRFAAAVGLDPFEGYLAGLMHNIGWTAALRTLDRTEGKPPQRFTRAFVQAFEPKRDAFFATLVAQWQLTDTLTALATELQAGGLAAAKSALGQALCAADRSASLEMLAAPADALTRPTHPDTGT